MGIIFFILSLVLLDFAIERHVDYLRSNPSCPLKFSFSRQRNKLIEWIVISASLTASFYISFDLGLWTLPVLFILSLIVTMFTVNAVARVRVKKYRPK